MGFVVRTLYLVSGIAVVLFLVMAISLLGTCDARYPTSDDARQQELAALAHSARERTDAVNELVEGRRSLFQAVIRFRQLSAESPVDLLPYLRIFHPGRSDDELHYLHVLMYVEANCRRTGADAAIVEMFRNEFESRRMSGTLNVEDPGEETADPQPC